MRFENFVPYREGIYILRSTLFILPICFFIISCGSANVTDSFVPESCPAQTILVSEGCLNPSVPEASQIVELIQGAQRDQQLRAVMAGVWQGDQVVFIGAFGQSTADVPARRDMHFRIGNVSTTFLMAVVLQLVDEGTLSLDDTVSKWFPLYPQANQITLRMLAGSTSGLIHYPVDAEFERRQFADPYRYWPPQELMSYGANRPFLFLPGTSWSFSDTGLVILGQVVEQATGVEIGTQIKNRIINRMGLSDTDVKYDTRMRKPVLHSFSSERGFYEDVTFWNPSWAPGLANLTSNLNDLHHWARILGEGELVSANSYNELLAPTNVGKGGNTADRYYALGTVVTNNWIVQNPGFTGYDGILAYLPSQQLTIAIFTTSTPYADQTVHHSTPIFQAIGTLLAPGTPPKLR